MPQEIDRDIAIIGMSCRVAGANSPEEFWDLLASSRDVQSQITRFNSEGFYHPDGGPRKGLTNVNRAYMLDDNLIDKFDNAFFYVTPAEAIAMDPQQRMLLEVAYEAIESAGIPLDKFAGTNTAVFAGMEGCEYHTIAARDLDATPRYLATGTPTCMAANRISYFFNLSGPSMSVDTACSSAMAALHQAVRALQHGDSRMAIACGAKLILSPDMFMPSSELGFLSPTGRCYTFDAAGDGYGRGEGVVALLLKPLKEAVANRDPIRAVIKGTRLNQDGKTQGITLPSASAQKCNMQALYEELGINPAQIQYLEAHGTGTAAGDTLEFSAINSVYGMSHEYTGPLVVGSVKSNIGHLEACSALGSILKTALCLERAEIPPQMNFQVPNPKIDFRNVKIPGEMVPWPKSYGGTRRAAVNVFGAGGTNGHAVLEAYSGEVSKAPTLEKRPYLFKVSAADDTSLKQTLEKFAEYVETSKPALDELAHTMLTCRSTLRKSLFFTASSHEEVVAALRRNDHSVDLKPSEFRRELIFLFTGQGAQWVQMGMSLVDHCSLFRCTLYKCDRLLSELPDPPSWKIIDELSKPRETSNIYKAEFSQPLCTVLQLSLVEVLKSWGATPDAVVGHSSGEIGAAYAAGILTMRDAMAVAYYRGLVLGRCAARRTRGSMCAVGLGESDTRSLTESFSGRIQIAAVNSPSSCTLSGDLDAIREIVENSTKMKRFCRELKVDQAYHSHHMFPLAADYIEKLTQAKVTPLLENTNCTMYSSVHCRRIDPSECIPRYWAQNMTSTVNFSTAFGESISSHPNVAAIVEVGPHIALKGPAQECLRSLGKPTITYLPTCMRGRTGFEILLSSAGAMIGAGLPLQSSNINAREIVDGLKCSHEPRSILTDAPSYQWNHSQGFWAESRVSRNVRFRKYPRHELLGSRYIDDIPNNPSWRNRFVLKEDPWLQNLKARRLMTDRGLSEMPAAAYLLMALEAASQLSPNATDPLCLSNVQLQQALPLSVFSDAETALEVQLIARQIDKSKNYAFDIYFQSLPEGDSWARHCSGKIETPYVVERPSLGCYERPHDQTLMNVAQALEPNLGVGLEHLQLNSEGSSGEFRDNETSPGRFLVGASILNSILRLPPMSILSQRPPAEYRISSLASLTVSKQSHRYDVGRFTTSIKVPEVCCVECEAEIRHLENTISMKGMRYQATKMLAQRPAQGSLFFKPVLLPDITTLSTSQPMNIVRCAELLTHKWPSCDVRVDDVPECCTISILEAFGATSLNARPRFRSIQCSSTRPQGMTDRVLLADASDRSNKYHLIVSQQISRTEQMDDQLHPGGLVCCPKTRIHDLKSNQMMSFEAVCDITGLDSDSWLLLRKTTAPSSAYTGRRIVTFTSQHEMPSFKDLGKIESVPLEPMSVTRFCERNDFTRFDAIIIDCPEKPVIASWTGTELMPWLQTLLKSAESIFWVTQNHHENRFSNIASSLLRTLQLEQPSLKISWIKMNGAANGNQDSLVIQVKQAYVKMVGREDELVQTIKGSEREILRYMPDDDLSAYTGVSLPRNSRCPLSDEDYSLVFITPGEPTIVSYKSSKDQLLSDDAVKICVEASVLDADDLQTFHNEPNAEVPRVRSGVFFTGKVTKSQNTEYPPESHVVGWHPDHVHSKKLTAEAKYLSQYPSSIQPSQAASRYAVLAVASCIVDGTARARRGESFLLDVRGPVLRALEQICKHVGASVVNSPSGSKVDFTVTFESSRGICVNDKPIDLAGYLHSDHGRVTLQRVWQESRDLPLEINEYEMADYRNAFRNDEQPYSAVFLYRNAASIMDHVPVRRKLAPMFTSHAHYVVIGGLGGLGRFICSWMIRNGARHITVISRSGAATQESRDAVSAMTHSGASVQSIKADACDRSAVSEILSRLRSEWPIRGVINLAMILGDAPMATMTAEQWDRVLRVKIDSSWILHEETRQDSLDFFILFSSIASVLGNRNQGNYNVANAALNALAEYRQSLDLPGISVALGAMTDMGVLYNLSQTNMLQILSRSGLTHLTQYHLGKIMEAAILESPRRDRSLLLTGLDMFDRESDGRLADRAEPLMWTDWPEFSHLSQYKISPHEGEVKMTKTSFQDQIAKMRHKGETEQMKDAIGHAFLSFLSQLLGFGVDTFDPSQALNMYGIDSLSGVSCQYWFHKELKVDVSAGQVLGGATIENIINGVVHKLVQLF